MKPLVLSREEVAKRLVNSEWHCSQIKEYRANSLWRTRYGFYFNVPHECSQVDFETILEDLRKHGRKQNI